MAATGNWRCADCDTFNAPAQKACIICDGTRKVLSTPAAAPPRKTAPRSAAKRPSSVKPTADWRCTRCDTNNSKADTSCIVCDTHWKAAARPPVKAAKKAPAKKATPVLDGPKRPAPAKPTPKKSASRPRPSSPTGSTSTTPRLAAPSRESLFHPPPGDTTGFTPIRPGPAPSASAPPWVAPATTAPPRWEPPPTSAPVIEGTGCLKKVIGWVVIPVLVFSVGKSCVNAMSSSDNTSGSSYPTGATVTTSTPAGTPTASGSAAPCPARIAANLPSGAGSQLVKAFRTTNKQITLCLTRDGRLYYFGEFSDRREPGIAMPARTTSGGYEANNPPYRYVIQGNIVTVYNSGTQVGREELTILPSPS